MTEHTDPERGEGKYAQHSYTSTLGAGSAHKRERAPLTSPSGEKHYSAGKGKLDARSIGRAAVARGARVLRRRGNVLAIIVFLTCLFIFFGALTGVGYIDPDAHSPNKDPEFIVGGPVFDASEGQALLEKEMAAQREREAAWRARKRPNAGAWIAKHRDAGARRIKDLKDEEREEGYRPQAAQHAYEERERVEAPAPAPGAAQEKDEDEDAAEAEAEEVAQAERDVEVGGGEVETPADPDAPMYLVEEGEAGEAEEETKEGGEAEAEVEAVIDETGDEPVPEKADEAGEKPAARPPKRMGGRERVAARPEGVGAHPEIPDHPGVLERD